MNRCLPCRLASPFKPLGKPRIQQVRMLAHHARIARDRIARRELFFDLRQNDHCARTRKQHVWQILCVDDEGNFRRTRAGQRAKPGDCRISKRIRTRHDLLHKATSFLLGDVLDRCVGLLDNRRELFVAAAIEVFLELAALALEIGIHVCQFALTLVSIRFGQHGCILLELLGSVAQIRTQALQLVIALLEFGLDLRLGGFCGG